jgi:hypothetical protein
MVRKPATASPPAAPGYVHTRTYFSILQAADFTATTSSWIEDQLRSGALPYRWAGNKRVIERRRLDELMNALPEEKGLCDVPAFMDRALKKEKAA